MTKTTQKAVETVAVGDVVWAHGYAWRVTANKFDPRGNASMFEAPMPRHVLVADAVEPGRVGGYAKGMTLGFSVGAPVCVEVTRAQHCTHPTQAWCDCDWCRINKHWQEAK